jgi:hypothetical protein
MPCSASTIPSLFSVGTHRDIDLASETHRKHIQSSLSVHYFLFKARLVLKPGLYRSIGHCLAHSEL